MCVLAKLIHGKRRVQEGRGAEQQESSQRKDSSLSVKHDTPSKLKFTGEAENKWIAKACDTCKKRQGEIT